MSSPLPGFERSSPDEDVQVTPAASIQPTRALRPGQIPARHHHRSNAINIPVSELPALHAPPSQPLPLTPAASQYAGVSATSAHRTQTGCTAPTFTLTAPHGITEAVLPCFEEDTPLLRSVTPELEPESQLFCDDGPGVVAENDNERPAEHEDEGHETSTTPGTLTSDQEHCTPESPTIVGRDEHGDEYQVTFVHIPGYVFEHSAPGKRFGGDIVVDLEHDGDTDTDTDVPDSAGDLDSMDDTESSTEDSEIDVDTVFSDADGSSWGSETDIDTLFSDVSSTSSSSEDSETDQDAGRLEADIADAHKGDVPAMFTHFNIQSDDEGHKHNATQAATRQSLPTLNYEGGPTAIWYPWLSRTMINPDGLVPCDEDGDFMGAGLSCDQHRLNCHWRHEEHIARGNFGVPLLIYEETGSECDQASDSDHPTNNNGNILHDHETADSSCPTIQWMHAFTEIIGVRRHLPRRVHQLRGEWPGHSNVDEGSSLVGRDWRDWRIKRRRARSLLRGCVGAEEVGEDDESE
ncbi:hypothetical protein LTR70_010397 [Exophiala xenobiotica]|uniref:Uncharacterized protein n=1 Tax=Lithohypha guttulata TaxID=1690604 RepID=A0ABR0JU70_9EURO|nr:hypothetical protein LTR24_010356 [Lithohypha guttulata]KAK5309321.1 hypothetical protein LTR70_010397 [Exophiala xenobiotica]